MNKEELVKFIKNDKLRIDLLMPNDIYKDLVELNIPINMDIKKFNEKYYFNNEQNDVVITIKRKELDSLIKDEIKPENIFSNTKVVNEFLNNIENEKYLNEQFSLISNKVCKILNFDNGLSDNITEILKLYFIYKNSEDIAAILDFKYGGSYKDGFDIRLFEYTDDEKAQILLSILMKDTINFLQSEVKYTFNISNTAIDMQTTIFTMFIIKELEEYL